MHLQFPDWTSLPFFWHPSYPHSLIAVPWGQKFQLYQNREGGKKIETSKTAKIARSLGVTTFRKLRSPDRS